jgi:hypothetical protein
MTTFPEDVQVAIINACAQIAAAIASNATQSNAHSTLYSYGDIVGAVAAGAQQVAAGNPPPPPK